MDLTPLFSRGTPLHSQTSLRVGGVAAWSVTPNSSEQLREALRIASSEGLPWFCLGSGANVLFDDSGFPGLVIHTSRLQGSHRRGETLSVAAGESLSRIARRACEDGLSGLEWACGIPGTVGGAVSMNAGAHGGQMADILVSADSASIDGVFQRSVTELGLGYRTSAYREGELEEIVTGVVLQLVRSTRDRTRREADRLLGIRRTTQPKGASAGCIFRNPPQPPTAGELLDRAGCKGLRVGRAVVSERHANFILNEGHENASDILTLIDQMRERVRKAFSVELETEIVIV